jgi:hypothetical protein
MATQSSAGPSGAPAAVLHPDQELPSCWQVAYTWEHDGQRGAWLSRTDDERQGWRGVPPLVQVVYNPDVGLRPARYVGLTSARQALVTEYRGTYGTFTECRERRTYWAERGVDIERRDWFARRRWEAAGKPGADDPYSYDPTPDPGPAPDDDGLLTGVQPDWINPIEIDPAQPWPARWQAVTHDGAEWAYHSPYSWWPVHYRAGAKLRTAHGVAVMIESRRQKLSDRKWEAQNGKSKTAPAPVIEEQQEEEAHPLSSPPEPGVERARWLGEQITYMMPRTAYLDWTPMSRRRVAARVALAKMNGYDAADEEGDALVLMAPASLQLQALNEYAGRVFSGQEDSDAVL